MENSLVSIVIGVFVVSFMLFVFYIISKKLTAFPSHGRESKYTKVIDRIIISRDKYIELVEIGDDILIIGVTSSSFSLLHTIKKEQLTENNQNIKYDSFKDIFNKMFNKNKSAMEENNEKNNL